MTTDDNTPPAWASDEHDADATMTAPVQFVFTHDTDDETATVQYVGVNGAALTDAIRDAMADIIRERHDGIEHVRFIDAADANADA